MAAEGESPHPAPEGLPSWPEYWQARGMPWRTEPEIADERQRYLAERRAVTPDVERGIYPFRDENGPITLTRADVEWLLATHENGRGPVNWHEEQDALPHSQRTGLDLRGADLRAVNLRGMPLARARGSLGYEAWSRATREQRERAAAHFERADLSGAHLQRADLIGAHLDGVNLFGAHLQRANLREARLKGANLVRAHLEGAHLRAALLEGADLRLAFLDSATVLQDVILYGDALGCASLADVRWNGANVTVVNWDSVAMLGKERRVRQRFGDDTERKAPRPELEEHRAAVRANRQLAAILREQGLSEEADSFAYRGQVLQRHVLRRQGRWRRAFGSWLLDAVSGYGYKPMRSVVAYILIVCLFAGAYLLNAQFAAPHLTWDESLVLSISSFHGRGFFTSGVSLGDTLARLAAVEAVIGLLIEITFIATFTQRFFAR